MRPAKQTAVSAAHVKNPQGIGTAQITRRITMNPADIDPLDRSQRLTGPIPVDLSAAHRAAAIKVNMGDDVSTHFFPLCLLTDS